MSTTGSSEQQRYLSVSLLPWVVWGLGCLFYFYEFLLQVSPSVMGNELMQSFSTDGAALGILAGAYFYSYAGMQIPVGILVDRYGPHRLLFLAALICAFGSIGFGLTNSFLMATVARFFIGFGSAFAVIGTMKLAANWFPSDRFALLTGLMVTIGMLGAIGGESPLALFIHHYGWRESMLFLGVAGLGIAALIYFFAQDRPQHKSNTTLTSSPPLNLWTTLKCALVNRQLWVVAFYGGLMYMPTPTLCGLWGVPFLTHKFGIDRPLAAAMISTIFIGWAIGSPIWGWISDRVGKRLPPMYIGTIGAILSFAILLYYPSLSLKTATALLFIFGLFSSGFLPGFSIAREVSEDAYCATSLSFMNMMNMVGVALAQPLIGRLLDSSWSGAMENGVRVYTLANFESALTFLLVGMVIALVLLPFIKETHCRPTQATHR